MNYQKKCILYGIIIFILSFIPILSLVFDYQEWDESQYTLASYDNYNHGRYLSYKTIDHHNHIQSVSFPYPNILYTWTFGAFNKIFHLPTNHDSRMKFTIVLSLLLSLSIIITYFIQHAHYAQRFSALVVGLIFILYFIFSTLWKTRNAQLGTTLLLVFSLFFLMMSYRPSSKRYLFEMLSVIFLFAAFYWKEQLIAIMLVFPWFISPLGRLKKRYKVLIYYGFLALVFAILYRVVYVYSINSGFNQAQYFYSHEGSHWGGAYSIESWFSKVAAIPMSYYCLALLFIFILQKDYKRMDNLENKMLVVGVAHFILTSTLYFYQSTGYIAAINYIVPLTLLPYFVNKIVIWQYQMANLILGIFIVALFFPIFTRLVYNYFPTRGKPIISWWLQKPLPPIPCILENKIAAVNIYPLDGVYLSKDLRKKPVIEYKDLGEGEFLKSLSQFQPEIIVYHADESEYPEVDRYMQLYRQAKIIRAKGVYYRWIRDISPDVMVYIRQSFIETGKNH